MEPKDALRPTTAAEFIGQKKLMARLDVHIDAAIEQERPLEHILLFGPPGFGKTTLAQIIANKLRETLYTIVMPIKPAAMMRFLREFEGGVVLFDELHRAGQAQQEDLLTLLEDGYITSPSGRRSDVGWFQAIGATTEPEKIIPPIFDRFPIKPTFEAYTVSELAEIALGMAHRVNVNMSDDDATILAKASGGTPRNCKSLVMAARDLAASGRPSHGAAVLELCQITPDGLTADHIEYLKALNKMGKPTGLAPLANMLRRNAAQVINDERLLLEMDLITFTESGRDITTLGGRMLRQDQPAAQRSRRGLHVA
jgi:holliday junction DNA helicase RuvB